ncbi:IS3 family transposase, partial [Lacticaseibacillus rhamnosus]|uniref:IS3 family transposase n=1 Tax=Lacticaseibacillus rhamnosus TaxID=47715 RepID=UPI0031F5B49D
NQRLTELHIRHSYSRKGCPYDNAPMKSFHASLKKECVYPVPVFEDYETAVAVLFEYVHAFYNMCMLSTIGREFIVHWATRPPYKLKLQHLRAKWPPDLMLSRVQISY